jgi:hypothetical protein
VSRKGTSSRGGTFTKLGYHAWKVLSSNKLVNHKLVTTLAKSWLAQSEALRLGPVLELEFHNGEAGDAPEVAIVDSQDRVA